MAAVRGGVSSCGSANTRGAGLPLPLPCIGDPTAASCVSPGSSPSRSKASRAATCYAADAKPKPDGEASAVKSRKVPLASSARHPAPPYGAGSLTHHDHGPASPSPCIRHGDDYREPHGGEDASPSVTQRLEKGQGRLPTRADFMKPSAMLQNIRLQTTKHPSLLDKRGAVSDWRFPKASGKENEAYDQNHWQNDTAPSSISSGSSHSAIFMKPSTPRKIRLQTPKHPSLLDRRVAGGNQLPPRFTHKAMPARLMRQAYSSDGYHQSVGAIDSMSDWSFPKVHEEDDEGNGQKHWQTDAKSSCMSSARDWNSESDGAFEGTNHSTKFMKPSSMPRNIRLQAPRHPSMLDRKVEGANQVPPRSIHKATPARLMHHSHSHNCRQHLGATAAINDRIFPKISEEEDEVDEQDQQTDTVSSHISSARDWNFEFDGAFKGRNHRAHLVKPSSMPRNIRLQIHRHPTLLDRRVDRINQVPIMCRACSSDNCHQHVGALDAINEWRLPKGYVVTTKCLRQSSFTTSNSSKPAPGPLGKVKGKAAIVREASAHKSGVTVGTGKKEAYITTLSSGGGYGYPHAPPFYKCEVCHKGTAFYRLKCCRLVVCECCGCACEPAETAEDDNLESRRGMVLAGKEKLPKVKLEGTDLFLWQPCSFPARLMLCMAKRNGNHLRYYFAPVDELMNPQVKVIRATVYDFRQHGHNARSLSVRNELLARDQLR